MILIALISPNQVYKNFLHTSNEMGIGVNIVLGKVFPECSSNFVTDFLRLLALSSNCFLYPCKIIHI